MAYKWEYIDPEMCSPKAFGFHRLWVVKVRKHDGERDVRGVYIRGWSIVAELLDYNPITGKELKESDWFIFAAKGE